MFFFIPRPLGHLHYIRIWHNNLGYDDFASWFLSAITIKDVQTGEKYEFICNKWLAVEHDDGEVSADENIAYRILYQQILSHTLFSVILDFTVCFDKF